MIKNYNLTLFFILFAALSCYGQYIVDFEGSGETKTAYASGSVVLNGIQWNMTQALIGTQSSDWRNGFRSARLRGYGSSTMTMTQDKTDGIGLITFSYRRYGTDTQVNWVVEYSANSGSSWTQIGSDFIAPNNNSVQIFSESVNVIGNIRVRIRKANPTGDSNRRLNIDDIQIDNFTVTTDPNLIISGTTDHGSSCLSTATAPIQYTITNNGTITANGINVVSDNPQFVVTNLSSTTIAPSSSATFDVTFTPSAVGAQSATITVTSSTGTSNSPNIGLIGTGITLPSISGQPTNQNEVIPNSATFSVASSDAITYQWEVSTNGGTTWNNVTGGTGATTDSYTTGTTAASINGNLYRCLLSNACGTTISNSATLSLTNSTPNNAQNLTGCFEDTTVDLTWNNPATPPTGGYVIFAIAGTTDPTAPPNDANTYTATTDFSAAPFETPATLGKVVYKGTGTSTTITGLTEDATYSFRIFAYNGEALTGWSTGTSAGSNEEDIAQGDVRNLTATPLTNQVTLNWLNPTPTSCWNEILIVANDGTVAFTPTGDGSAYTANATYSGANQVVYKGSGNSVAISGLTNGTNYCFRAFIRRGTTWTSGVEVCAVPTLTYCLSEGNTSFSTGITGVVFNTINNLGTATNVAYTNFTSLSTTVLLGESYNLEVNVNTDGNFEITTRVWIDWNNDGDFSDSNEEYDLGNALNVANGATDESPLLIEIPTNAVISTTRMRVATKYDNPIDAPTPCETGFDGEVEDYTIVIQQPTDAEINIEGNNISIPNGFNAPFGLNNTLFAATNIGATSIEKSYIIENIGATILSLTGAPRVEITGAHAGDFNVTLQPNAAVASSSNSEFRIEFSPTADGIRTATVVIANSDSNENPYTFLIEGTGVCTSALTSSIWPMEGTENAEVTITSATNLTGATAEINGIAMTTVTSTATELIVLVPAGAITGNLSVQFSNGCSSINPFTVITNIISGCETSTSSVVPSDLFISGVSDATTGSSSFIEIYNGTTTTRNLTNYRIRIYNNGNTSPNTDQVLSGTISPGDVYVVSVGTSSCDPTLNGLASGLPNAAFNSSGGINFDNNSSDAIALFNISAGTDIDVFGIPNSNSWANGIVADGDGVYFERRNDAATLPSSTFIISDWNQTEWTTCSDTDYSFFGAYDFSLGVPPTVSVLSSPFFNCTTPIQLTVSASEGVAGGLGLTYQWFYLEPNTNTFVAVPDNADFDNVTNATLDLLNPINYGNYQFYCQVRENTASCYQASNTVKLEIETAIWDGSWSSAPSAEKLVIIDDDYTTSTVAPQISFEACNCHVTNGNTLIIGNNTFVLVENNLTVDGTIIVRTDGAFVQTNDSAIIDGAVLSDKTKISVEKETAPLATFNEYTYWSSPVVGEVINQGLFEADPSRIYSFNAQNYLDATQETANDNTALPGQDDIDDNGDDWQPESATVVMLPGVGYAASHDPMGFVPNRYIYTFEGVFNNGTYTVPVFRNDAETNDNNWNFIGNPYPSAIDADEFLDANASIDQSAGIGTITGAIFFWSHNTAANNTTNGNEGFNYSQSDYAIINGSGETMGGDMLMPTRYIPSGQGFFISMSNSATSTSAGGSLRTTDIVFNNSMRVTGNNNQFFRDNTQDNKLWLNLSSDNGVFNQILVAYVDGATDGNDGMYYDAYKNLGTEFYSGIYSLIDASSGKKFAIQGKHPDSLNLDEVVSLGFSTSIEAPTIYTISIHQLEGQFMNDTDIYIIDYQLNTIQNLKEADYTFTSDVGDYDQRFEIVFRADALSLDDHKLNPNQLSIIELTNGKVKFTVGNSTKIMSVQILDVTGRQIYDLDGSSSNEVYDLSLLSQAAYIAKVTLSNGQVISKKAIKQH